MAEKVFLASPLAAGRGGVIVSPFQFILTGDDHLKIEGWNAVTGAVLSISYRHAALDGQIRATVKTLALTADRVQTSLNIPLAEGYLVNMEIHVIGATPQRGQTFCCVKLIRGLTGATFLLGLMLQGYVTAEQGLGWPGSPIMSSLEGPGTLRRVQGTAPAAGVDIFETVPSGARWVIRSVRVAMVPDALGGPVRVPYLRLGNGVNTLIVVPLGAAIAPPNPIIANWIAGLGYAPPDIGFEGFAGLPPGFQLFGGWTIAVLANPINPLDIWSPPGINVEEWLEAA